MGNNISDDNLVEITVKAIKELLQSQGVNAYLQSHQTACVFMKYINEIKKQLHTDTGLRNRNGNRSNIDKKEDILKIASAICAQSCTFELGISYVQKINHLEFFN